MAFSTRTIFLFIRGIDQTGRALEKPYRDMTKLEKAQAALSRTGYRLMFAGAAFTMFAALAGRAIMGLLESTSLGQLYLEDFTRTFDRLKQGLAEAVMDNFGPVIEGWLATLDDLAKNEEWKRIVAGLIVPATITLGAVGVSLVAVGLGMKIVTALAVAVGKVAGLEAAGAIMLGGEVALMLAVAIVLSFVVSQIIWSMIPEKMRESIKALREQAEAYVAETGIPIRMGQQPGDIMWPEGQKPMFGLGGFTQRQITINTQNFFENVYTGAENEEDLSDAIDEAIIDALTNIEGPDVE